MRTLLDAYVAASKGNIILEVVDPRPFSEEEDRAVAFGIDGFTGTNGEQLFFGLAATNSTTGRATITVFAPDREAFLEYDLTRLVSHLGRRGKPVVALIDGIGLSGNPMMRVPEQQALAQMKQFFDVKPVTGTSTSFRTAPGPDGGASAGTRREDALCHRSVGDGGQADYHLCRPVRGEPDSGRAAAPRRTELDA